MGDSRLRVLTNMSQDDTDNPRPDDPLTPRDVTILRPRPGASRRPAPQAPVMSPSPPPVQGSASSMSVGVSSSFAGAPAPSISQSVGADAVPLAEWITTGANPLLQAAVPLLVLAGRLRGQISNADVESLRRQTIQEIRTFEERVRRAEVPPEDVLAARYALCTAIDEAVLNTPWGAQSDWSSQSLLVQLGLSVWRSESDSMFIV